MELVGEEPDEEAGGEGDFVALDEVGGCASGDEVEFKFAVGVRLEGGGGVGFGVEPECAVGRFGEVEVFAHGGDRKRMGRMVVGLQGNLSDGILNYPTG